MQSTKRLTEILLDFIRTNNPDNVETCINLIKKETGLSYKESEKFFFELVDENNILLKNPIINYPKGFFSYLLGENALWFRILVSLTLFNTIIYLIVQLADLNFFLGVMGLLHSFLLPGFSLYKLIFPLKEDNAIEIIIMSFGLSISFVPMLGYVTYLIMGKLTYFPLILILTLFIFIASLIGIFREYRQVQSE
jgi:hypothetical protein